MEPKTHPLDHDQNDVKGGSAPIPDWQHLVVIKASVSKGLTHGEVIAVSDQDAKVLLKTPNCRVANPDDIELAQPRIRVWTS